MLRLRPHPGNSGADAYQVVSGEAVVGIINKSTIGEHWIWCITGFYTSPRDRGPSWGSAASREDCFVAFTDHWRSWLDWAGLREVDQTGDIDVREVEVDARRLLHPHED